MTPGEAKAMLHALAEQRHRHHWISTQMLETMKSERYLAWLTPLFELPPTPKTFACFLRAATTPHLYLMGLRLVEAFGTFAVAHRQCSPDCDVEAPAAVASDAKRRDP